LSAAGRISLHPNQLNRWKATALKGLPGVFADGRAAEKVAAADHAQQINDLYAEIGKLITQVAWLTIKYNSWHLVFFSSPLCGGGALWYSAAIALFVSGRTLGLSISGSTP
jgi:hypothetical protein